VTKYTIALTCLCMCLFKYERALNPFEDFVILYLLRLRRLFIMTKYNTIIGIFKLTDFKVCIMHKTKLLIDKMIVVVSEEW
jgi:hypothetical protein